MSILYFTTCKTTAFNFIKKSNKKKSKVLSVG